MKTIGEVASWIMDNRKGKAFEGYSFSKIVGELSDCLDSNSAMIVAEGSSILGVICAKVNVPEKSLFVHDILTTKRGVVRIMLEEFHRRFDGFVIEGLHRSGRPRLFKNTHKLERMVF